MPTPPLRKKWAIVRRTPEVMPGYPHPECITGGWMALLSQAERLIVDAKAMEMRAIDQLAYREYTGFDALDAEAQSSIRRRLDENKQWEKTYGTVWFRAPNPLDPRLLILPDAKAWTERKEWKGKYVVDAYHGLCSRKRQADRMIANDEFPVRTFISRS